MILEEANKIVDLSIFYGMNKWKWCINTKKPYGNIIGYDSYDTPNEALEAFNIQAKHGLIEIEECKE